MMVFLRRIRANEKGSAIVLFALLLTVLAGFSALVMDIGQLVVVRQKLTNVADAAVLSGAKLLPDAARAEQEAIYYAELNGVARDDVDVSTTSSNRISVTLHGLAEYGFARILGIDRQNVTVSAEALIGAIKSVKGALPLGIVNSDFVYGETYHLKVGSHTSGDDSYNGNYHAIALGGTGSSTYEDNLKYGYQGNTEIGQTVETEPGNMVGATRQGMEYRLSLDPHSTYDNIAYGSSRLLLVPIVDTFQVSGRTEIRIVGLAAFFLEDYRGSGEIVGRFLHYVAEGEIDETSADSGYGLTGVKLIR